MRPTRVRACHPRWWGQPGGNRKGLLGFGGRGNSGAAWGRGSRAGTGGGPGSRDCVLGRGRGVGPLGLIGAGGSVRPGPPPYHPCQHPFQQGLVCGIALQRLLPLLPHHALQGGDEVLSDSKGVGSYVSKWVFGECVNIGQPTCKNVNFDASKTQKKRPCASFFDILTGSF